MEENKTKKLPGKIAAAAAVLVLAAFVVFELLGCRLFPASFAAPGQNAENVTEEDGYLFYYFTFPFEDADGKHSECLAAFQAVRRIGPFWKELSASVPMYDLVTEDGRTAGILYIYGEDGGYYCFFRPCYTPDPETMGSVLNAPELKGWFLSDTVGPDNETVSLFKGSYFRTASRFSALTVNGFKMTVVPNAAE